MIAIENLTKKFDNGSVAVDSINLDIRDGEIMGFAGLNGAGKTTTIRIIAGLTRPTAGRVLIDGHDIVTEKVAASSAIGMVPEFTFFDRQSNPIQLLTYFAGFYGIGKRTAFNRIEELLKQFSLYSNRFEKLGNFSQGMLKRFSIVASLLNDPKNLVLDEVLNGLDPDGIRILRSMLRDMRMQGKSIFLSTHILTELEGIADRIAIIHRGRIAKVIDTREIFDVKGKKIIIRIENPDERIDQILGKFGIVERNGKNFVLNNTSTEISILNSELTTMGYRISELRNEGRSLEDLFFKLVNE
ncbi:MAG: ABC transporter ATP-binding protein [Candidatus Thermoplasmatota archaeon]|nr:ABC transporter ATP-binding protein [Candidatus Thermoplasmatota archaeon]